MCDGGDPTTATTSTNTDTATRHHLTTDDGPPPPPFAATAAVVVPVARATARRRLWDQRSRVRGPTTGADRRRPEPTAAVDAAIRPALPTNRRRARSPAFSLHLFGRGCIARRAPHRHTHRAPHARAIAAAARLSPLVGTAACCGHSGTRGHRLRTRDARRPSARSLAPIILLLSSCTYTIEHFGSWNNIKTYARTYCFWFLFLVLLLLNYYFFLTTDDNIPRSLVTLRDINYISRTRISQFVSVLFFSNWVLIFTYNPHHHIYEIYSSYTVIMWTQRSKNDRLPTSDRRFSDVPTTVVGIHMRKKIS